MIDGIPTAPAPRRGGVVSERRGFQKVPGAICTNFVRALTRTNAPLPKLVHIAPGTDLPIHRIPAIIASNALRFDSTVACGPTTLMKTFRPEACTIAPSCMHPGRGAAAPIPM